MRVLHSNVAIEADVFDHEVRWRSFQPYGYGRSRVLRLSPFYQPKIIGRGIRSLVFQYLHRTTT